MNWCKTCKKELPMEASCNIAPECSVCRSNRLQRELEQAQRERDDARLKADGWKGLLEIANTSLRELAEESDDLRAKLLASEAAGAEMREVIKSLIPFANAYSSHPLRNPNDSLRVWLERADKALSTLHGQSFLDERERLVRAIERLIPFAVAYRSHPLRNQNDNLDDVLEQARTTLQPPTP